MKKILFRSLGLFLTVFLICRCQQPRPAATASSDEGAKLFVANCSRCHQSTGGGGAAPGNSVNAPDIRQFTKSASDIDSIISYGYGQMPAFKDSLSGENISQIAAYVASQIEYHAGSSSAPAQVTK